MGNIDSRSHIEGGYLFVKTDRPFYYGGNTVYGKIYIRAEQAIDAKWMEIKIEGKEKMSFKYHEYEGEGEHRRRVTRKHKEHRKIFDFRGNAFTFEQHLNPGDFTVPFEFTLPQRTPASILFINKSRESHPKAKIRYSVQAILHTHSGKILKYK